MKSPVIVPRLGQSSVDVYLALGPTPDPCPVLCLQREAAVLLSGIGIELVNRGTIALPLTWLDGQNHHKPHALHLCFTNGSARLREVK